MFYWLPEANTDTHNTTESKGYPKSIQAGLPRLGQTPAGWTRYRLRDLLYPIQRPAELINDAKYQLITAKRNRGGIVQRGTMSGDQIRTKSQFYVKSGDFIISNRQISHGACGLVPPELDGAIVSNEYTPFHSSGNIKLEFLNVLSHSMYFQQTCFHSSIGVHVEKLVFRLDVWLNWEFDIPSLDEQTKIIDILGTWDCAIEKSERLLAALVQRRAGLLHRFYDHLSDGLYSSADGHSSILGNFFSYRQEPGRPDLPTLSVTMHDGLVHRDGLERRTESALEPEQHLLVKRGDIAYNMMRMWQGACGLAEMDAMVSPAYVVLVPNEKVDSRFAFYWFKSSRLLYRLWAYSHGLTEDRLRLYFGDFCQIPASIPPLHRQREIAAALDASDRGIRQTETHLEGLRAQRRGLMQKLLSGEWRLGSPPGKAALRQPISAET